MAPQRCHVLNSVNTLSYTVNRNLADVNKLKILRPEMSWVSQVGQCNNKSPYWREAGEPVKDEEMVTETGQSDAGPGVRKCECPPEGEKESLSSGI